MNDSDRRRLRLRAIGQRLQIDYPCRWLYKVIGESAERVQAAVLEVVEVDSGDVTIERSHVSSRGRYVSFNVEVTVRSEGERIAIYEALRRHNAIRLVL